MADLFKDVIPSILQTKKNVLKDETDIKEYVPFVINRALSYHDGCILYANQMNMHNQLDKDMQYSYLLNSIRPMKRKFKPWQKSELDKNIQCIKDYFGYSNEKARDVLRILSDKQIAEIKAKTDKGGVTKT
jgi:hypothetical protein